MAKYVKNIFCSKTRHARWLPLLLYSFLLSQATPAFLFQAAPLYLLTHFPKKQLNYKR